MNVVKKGAQEPVGSSAKRKRKITPPEKREERTGRIISAPRENLDGVTSIRLTEVELAVVKALALKRKQSASELIRLAIQRHLGRQGKVKIPPTIGIVNGVYPATIHDDVVTLANLTVELGFMLQQFEQSRMTLKRRRDLRAMLNELISKLNDISGRTAFK